MVKLLKLHIIFAAVFAAITCITHAVFARIRGDIQMSAICILKGTCRQVLGSHLETVLLGHYPVDIHLKTMAFSTKISSIFKHYVKYVEIALGFM